MLAQTREFLMRNVTAHMLQSIRLGFNVKVKILNYMYWVRASGDSVS